jgi:hypothetical protein
MVGTTWGGDVPFANPDTVQPRFATHLLRHSGAVRSFIANGTRNPFCFSRKQDGQDITVFSHLPTHNEPIAAIQQVGWADPGLDPGEAQRFRLSMLGFPRIKSGVSPTYNDRVANTLVQAIRAAPE